MLLVEQIDVAEDDAEAVLFEFLPEGLHGVGVPRQLRRREDSGANRNMSGSNCFECCSATASRFSGDRDPLLFASAAGDLLAAAPPGALLPVIPDRMSDFSIAGTAKLGASRRCT